MPLRATAGAARRGGAAALTASLAGVLLNPAAT
jgi:hypothetical protein